MTNKLKRTLSPNSISTTSTPPSSAPSYSATDAHPASSSSTHSAPSYTATDAPPTFTTFPSTFAINGKHTQQLVDTLALKRHLRLLAAFHELKQRVQLVREGCAAELSEEARWSVFVSMAVHRFEMYLEQIVKKSVREVDAELPPLDVALVLHSYLLNPRRFREDTIRMHIELDRVNDLLLDRFADTIDPISLQPTNNVEQMAAWKSATATAFDPLEAFVAAQGRYVRCPRTLQTLYTPWVTPDGKGYAQQGFSIPSSPGSQFLITHEVLGISKLIRDIQLIGGVTPYYLAGTLFSSAETADSAKSLKRAERIRALMMTWRSPFFSGNAQVLGERMEWSIKGARAAFVKCLRREGPGLTNMLSAYTRGEPFSLDLASAVLRQGTFITKMHALGWTRPGRFDEDEVLLQRSVARYHAFLDLISRTPSTFFVPTLDIDLAWHSHQLNALKYRDDTIGKVGRFIDHDDKVEENTLSTAFDVTARAWQARFNVPYSICGCPIPSEKTSSKLFSVLRSKPSLSPTTLLGSPSSNEDADATHASEHNSILLINHPKAQKERKKREKVREERRVRDEKRALKGGVPDEKRRDGTAHEAAFLMPVPMYMPVGFYGMPVGGGGGGCAATSGNMVDANSCPPGGEQMIAGSCAVGAGACGGGNASSCGSTGGGCAAGGCGGGGGMGGCGGGGSGGGGGGCGGGGSSGGGGCGGGS